MHPLETKIKQLIDEIHQAFAGVELGNGVSWREADVLDDYGSMDERKQARNLDEKKDWTLVPDELIGDLKYQSVLPFLDIQGLRYYLPPCMIFALKHYATSSSIIIHSTIYRLTDQTNVMALKEILTVHQKQCIIRFLMLCIEIGEDYFDLHKVENRLQKYWMEG
jgi:hypothetical protein